MLKVPKDSNNKKNNNFHLAKKMKNDEFYTQLKDIENEVKYYKNYFRGKIVFCNCDDPEWSNFWKYFYLNFKQLGLKKLISTHYTETIGDDVAFKFECIENKDGELILSKTFLKDKGDFRSEECIEFLKESDIIVTNPPFSLFREYISQLIQYEKKFLIIGNLNAIPYKEVFKLIKENKIWLGVNSVKEFMTPNKEIQKFGNICWFTNLTHKKRNEEITLYKNYSAEDYPTYDNYNAINVAMVKDIPLNYGGNMGVPITFLDKFNPNQFQIIGIDRVLVEELTGKVSRFKIKDKELYARIVIKKIIKDTDES